VKEGTEIVNKDFFPQLTNGDLFNSWRYIKDLLRPISQYISSIYTRSALGANYVIIRFDNGYGVSIALSPGSAAEFLEMSIIKFHGHSLHDYDLVQTGIPIPDLKGHAKEDILHLCNRVSLL
jgi:hypothetical protein